MARNTKASRILNDSAMRLEAARMRVDLAQSQLNTAKATRDVLQEAHLALEKELTPQPRKKSTPKPAAAQKDKPEPKAQASNGANCAICGNPADHSDHDPTYLSSHVFEVPGKGKKARKSAVTSSEVENVSAVGASAGD